MSSPTLWICPRSPVCTVSLRIALYMFAEGCLSVFIAFHAAIYLEAASHICCTAFFPMFSLKRLQKTEMNPSVGRLRKRSVGPKRQERSRGRERRLCDVTGKVIKGQSVGRGSGRKGGGEQERLQWISWIICICYLITWKALEVADYHKGKLFPSHVDPDV